MKHYALRLPAELIEAIKKDAKKNERSTSAQIRLILNKHLNMKKIITVFALLSLLSCKKEEPVVAKETTTTTVIETTYEDKVFYFAQDMAGLGKCNLQFEDLDGNPIESVNYYVNPCQDMFFTLVDNESYRIKFWSRNTAQQYVNLEFEAVVTYENGELTVNKTAGNYNMYYTDDCGVGMNKHLVK